MRRVYKGLETLRYNKNITDVNISDLLINAYQDLADLNTLLWKLELSGEITAKAHEKINEKLGIIGG